jgi:hypothetical protein
LKSQISLHSKDSPLNLSSSALMVPSSMGSDHLLNLPSLSLHCEIHWYLQ